jgi:hypothetical protein
MQLPSTAVFEAPGRIAHEQATVAVPGAAPRGLARPDPWLVRFRPEAAR